MMNYLLVFMGGGLGSICRYGISKAVPLFINKQHIGFPFATFFANIISCIILGFLVGLTIKEGITGNQKLILMTGFCGGFSTFSTFTNETYQLFQNGQTSLAFLYVMASLLVCLVCIFIGLKMAEYR